MGNKKELVLNSAWCKGCGICAAFCPKKALELVDGKSVDNNSLVTLTKAKAGT